MLDDFDEDWDYDDDDPRYDECRCGHHRYQHVDERCVSTIWTFGRLSILPGNAYRQVPCPCVGFVDDA